MIEMSPARWRATSDYVDEVFGAEDEALARLSQEARAAGLPDIAVSAGAGRLLALLTRLTPARLAVEVGTLGAYSSIWIARALAPGGRLYTIELDAAHADFAQAQLERAGVADRVELCRGAALEVLPALLERLAPASVDLAFIDAVKSEYEATFALLRDRVSPGGLLIADNVLGTGQWWIDQADHPDRAAVDRFNRRLAADPGFEVAAVPLREGLLIARRR